MTGAPTQAELDAARLVLDRMGVTAEDLLNSVKPPAPTFGEYIPVVAAAVSDGTRRAYSPYWNRVLDQWADISLSDRTPTDIQRLVQHIKANLTVYRPESHRCSSSCISVLVDHPAEDPRADGSTARDVKIVHRSGVFVNVWR